VLRLTDQWRPEQFPRAIKPCRVAWPCMASVTTDGGPMRAATSRGREWLSHTRGQTSIARSSEPARRIGRVEHLSQLRQFRLPL